MTRKTTVRSDVDATDRRTVVIEAQQLEKIYATRDGKPVQALAPVSLSIRDG